MKSKLPTLVFAATLFGMLSAPVGAQDRGRIAAMSSNDWNVEVVADDLDYPWEIVQRDGRIYITEAAGNVVLLDAGQQRRFRLHTSTPIARVGGGGLLGMALSPDFPTSGVAYFYHTYESTDGLSNKVIEARFDGTEWTETRTLLDGIPGHRLYNGGRVEIGPDRLLYVTTGWTENRSRPQDLSSLAGKVLRMTADGKVPAANPFPGSYIYTYGHRNPQGLAWSPMGELFEVEHGQSARDEINVLKPGANYGWPLIDGPASRDGMEPAFLNSGSDTWAPSGAAFAGNELLVATLGSRSLSVYDARTKSLKPVFENGDRFRDVLPAAGALYLITTNRSPRAEGRSQDHLLRLTPKS